MINVDERTASINSVTPKFRGIVKFHKETSHHPTRYRLKENFNFDTIRNIRNNQDLIDGLDKLKIKSNDKVFSSNVCDMFGEISKEPRSNCQASKVEICRDTGRYCSSNN